MLEVLAFALVMVAGYVARVVVEGVARKSNLYVALVTTLTRVVYYVLVPLGLAAVFLRRGLLLADLYVAVYYALLLATIYAVARHIKASSPEAFFLVSAFPNSVFLGFPVVIVLFGRIDIAAVFGTLTLLLNILVPEFMAKKKASLSALLGSPPLLGFAVGVAGHFTLGSLAEVVYEYLYWSPLLLSYTATFVMGLRMPLKLSIEAYERKFIALVAACRFAIAPALALGVGFASSLSTTRVAELAVVAAMPPAVMNVVVAGRYNWEPELVAKTVAFLTVVFLVLVFPAIYLAL